MLHLKQTLSSILLGLGMLSTNSYAEETYQTEINIGYEKEDADTSTYKGTTLSAEVFLTPVSTDNKPLKDAAFLDRSSSITVGYIKGTRDLLNSSLNTFDNKGLLFAINYITDSDAIILGALYSNQDANTEPNLYTGDQTVAGFRIGKYIDYFSAIYFSYSNYDVEYQGTVSNWTVTRDIDSYELFYSTVRPLNNTNYYKFNAGIELIKNSVTNSSQENNQEDNLELTVLGQYYFTRMTSLGAEFLYNSGDDVSEEGITLAVDFTHFFAPPIALNINFASFDADDAQNEDEDSISLDVIARF